MSWHCAKDKTFRLFAQRWVVLLVDVDVDVVLVLVDDVDELDDVEVDVDVDVLVNVDVVLVVVSHSAQVLAHCFAIASDVHNSAS